MKSNIKYLASGLGLIILGVSAGCGSDGAPGEAGVEGRPGADGQTGEEGKEGQNGEDGLDGLDGEPGAAGKDGERATTTPWNEEVILLSGERFFPEGVAIDAHGFLYTGSIPNGDITRVNLKTGEQSLFSAVSRNAIGMLATAEHLLVCDVGMTTGYAEPSAVLVLDLKDGKLLGRHALPAGAQFCNDLTVDSDGNVYVTESFANAIYELRADDLISDSALAPFASDAVFSANMVFGNFGLNGLSFDGDSTIYVVNFYSGELFAIPLLDDGKAGPAALVSLKNSMGENVLLGGPDGMKWAGPHTLMVSEQSKSWLSRVDLNTGIVYPVGGGFDVPSTFAFDEDGDAWVVNSQLDDFMSGNAPHLPFTLEKVLLDELIGSQKNE